MPESPRNEVVEEELRKLQERLKHLEARTFLIRYDLIGFQVVFGKLLVNLCQIDMPEDSWWGKTVYIYTDIIYIYIYIHIYIYKYYIYIHYIHSIFRMVHCWMAHWLGSRIFGHFRFDSQFILIHINSFEFTVIQPYPPVFTPLSVKIFWVSGRSASPKMPKISLQLRWCQEIWIARSSRKGCAQCIWMRAFGVSQWSLDWNTVAWCNSGSLFFVQSYSAMLRGV